MPQLIQEHRQCLKFIFCTAIRSFESLNLSVHNILAQASTVCRSLQKAFSLICLRIQKYKQILRWHVIITAEFYFNTRSDGVFKFKEFLINI